MDRANRLRRRPSPRGILLRRDPRLLAGTEGQATRARLLRDSAEDRRPEGESRGLRDLRTRRAQGPWPRASVRHRVTKADEHPDNRRAGTQGACGFALRDSLPAHTERRLSMYTDRIAPEQT